MTFLDEEEQYRVNAFDWQAAFPFGKFQVVIGNPPYVRQESLGQDKSYFQKAYQVYAGTADLYAYFIEKGISLLAPGGKFSYIVANKWMRANYGKPLRTWLKDKCIEEIIDFGDLRVFENATTYPCIIRVANQAAHYKPWVANVKTLEFASLTTYVKENGEELDQAQFSIDAWTLANNRILMVLSKLNYKSMPLEKYINGQMYRGVLTGLNEAFVIDETTKNELIKRNQNSSIIIKPFLIGREIKRFHYEWDGKYLIFTRRGINIKDFPAIYEYLLNFKERLMPKPKNYKGNNWPGRKTGSYQWYEIQDSIDYFNEFEKPKIIYPNICKKPEFTLDDKNFFSNQKSYIISINDLYLLGILNSKIMMFYFVNKIPKLRGDFYEPGFVFMKDFPIRTIDFNNPGDVAQHERMVSLVQSMLDMHKQLQQPLLSQEKERLQRQIDWTDNEIDKLVYELYGLTDDEIRIVEGE
jgi:hypothetical protein